MPTYMGQTVTDEQVQELCTAYRDGQKAAKLPVEDSDQVILDRCAEAGVVSPRAPSAFSLGTGTPLPGSHQD